MMSQPARFVGRSLIRDTLNIATAVIALVVTAGAARAQWISQQFASPGPNDRVYGLIMHDDGTGAQLYAGGIFDSADGVFSGKIARWDGQHWSAMPSPLHSGFGGYVRSFMTYQGQLIVGGQFVRPNGEKRSVMRWSGSQWESLGASINDNGEVATMAIFNGELIVGGTSTTVSGSSTPFTARWNGSVWQTMDAIVGTRVSAMAVWNGQLIAGGSFTSPGANIARWNGVAWIGMSGSFDNAIGALAVFNGDLYAGGSFSMAGPVAAARIARWNGVAWQALTSGIVGSVSALAVYDGKLAVGGTFTTAGGITSANLALWTGSAWEAVNDAPSNDLTTTSISCLLSVPVDLDGQPALYVGGWFALAGGQCANNVARLSSGVWSKVSNCPECLGLSGPVKVMKTHDDGNGEALYVAGACRCFGGVRSDRIARWDGSTWSALADGVAGRVFELCEFGTKGQRPDLIVGGAFNFASGVPASNIALWDGSAWNPMGGGVTGGFVTAMAVFDDGTGPALYVGGTFTSAGGVPVHQLAKWDGRAWSDVGGGVALGTSAATVIDLLVWDDGTGPSLVVAGRFTSAGAGAGQVLTRGIARWRTGAWATIGPVVGGSGGSGGVSSSTDHVDDLDVWPPGNGTSLICAGTFQTIGGVQAGPIAIWNGTAWTRAAPTGLSGVSIETNAIEAVQDGSCQLLFAHAWYEDFFFTRWNGVQWSEKGGGLWDVAGVIWTSVIGGIALEYFDFETFQGKLYVGGDFTLVGVTEDVYGQSTSNFAIWDYHAALACGGDVNHDHQVNVADLLAVITHWGLCADCDADPTPCGGDGVVNVADLLEVISHWGPCG